MPRAHIPLLQHQGAARPEESDVAGDLVRSPPSGAIWNLAWTRSNDDDSSLLANRSSFVSTALPRASVSTNWPAAASIAPSISVPTTWPSGPTHSLSNRSHPIAPHSTSRARAPRLFADLVEKPATARFPHPRLEMQPLELRRLICQQVRRRRHLHAPLANASKDAPKLARFREESPRDFAGVLGRRSFDASGDLDL
jgi:hypothetical protein